jgi:hypothetical protein
LNVPKGLHEDFLGLLGAPSTTPDDGDGESGLESASSAPMRVKFSVPKLWAETMEASRFVVRNTINWAAALTKHVNNLDVDLPFVDDALLDNYIRQNLTKIMTSLIAMPDEEFGYRATLTFVLLHDPFPNINKEIQPMRHSSYFPPFSALLL